MNWDHIRTFHAVAEDGSLLAAARRLGLTQPTVGRHIDLLEEALGFSLFIRGRTGMRLTEQGAGLVEMAAAMSGAATDFGRRASGLEDRVEGTVRLSANEIFGTLLLPGIVADLMAEHPEIEIELEVSNAVTNLLQRDADIAVRLFRPTQNDLIARKITDLPLGLYAHERYVARAGAPSEVEDLADHVLIGLDRDSGMISAYRAMGLDLAPHDFAFRTDNNIAGINAVRAGIGIGPLHSRMADRWPDLTRVLPALRMPSYELWLACHADVRHNRRIRLAMGFLADRLRSPYSRLIV